jgi:hypothetical protein
MVVHEVQAALVLIDRLVVALPPQKVIAEFVSLKRNEIFFKNTFWQHSCNIGRNTVVISKGLKSYKREIFFDNQCKEAF